MTSHISIYKWISSESAGQCITHSVCLHQQLLALLLNEVLDYVLLSHRTGSQETRHAILHTYARSSHTPHSSRAHTQHRAVFQCVFVQSYYSIRAVISFPTWEGTARCFLWLFIVFMLQRQRENNLYYTSSNTMYHYKWHLAVSPPPMGKEITARME